MASASDREPLTGGASAAGAREASKPWFYFFLGSCTCNVLLLMAVGYLLWYAMFRPPSTSACLQDYHENLESVRANVSAVVAEKSLANASQAKIDCFLAKYKAITFELANYSDDPVAYQWKMQIGSKEQMSEVFAERRHMMSANNYRQLYDLLNADGVWAFLYSRYYPGDVQEELMQVDLRETSMMVTMVKMPECIDEMVDTYRFENYEKYYYYASNAKDTARMHKASEDECETPPA
ncbi:unnamed protein product [Symbiodinium necroappetens]|uniref:Uncharacterized protein n=1 Tax=Symbiodinium necroappetens TaxID=1628268 RepID=A0A812VZ30_9DINO|nr:unnamed protein product [Symbiodinium necroappetens]